MKVRFFLYILVLSASTSICEARIANPYPIAVLRQGDIYLIEGKGKWQQLTQLGDVQEICWLDLKTICFSRKLETGLADQENWSGLEKIYDLFTISKEGGTVKQFTANHFARRPSPSPMNGRALFWHDVADSGIVYEIWETIHPLRRDRPLGIRGISPDCSPDRKWTAASLGYGEPEGVGLYRYPTNDAYRKVRGLCFKPRFSPDGRSLTYLNYESGRAEIWGFDIPDGEPRRLLGTTSQIKGIIDFGWTEDGSGYILILGDDNSKRDVYYWEIERQSLLKLSETGDIQQATAWH